MAQKRILIVEDTASILDIQKQLLASRPVSVDSCMDGKEGLARAKATKPDLLVLDAMLPGMTGFDICSELKSNPTTRDIPIFMLTSITEGTNMTDAEWAAKTGANAFLSKPFSANDFLEEIDKLLS